MKYLLQSIRNRGDYILLSPSREKLATLTLPKWYNKQALCSVGDKNFEIKHSTSDWWNQFDLIQNDIDLGKIEIVDKIWSRKIALTMKLGSKFQKKYELKEYGWGWYTWTKLLLKNVNGDIVMQLIPKFNSPTWSFNYELIPGEPFMGESPDNFFLISILCGYASKRLRDSN